MADLFDPNIAAASVLAKPSDNKQSPPPKKVPTMPMPVVKPGSKQAATPNAAKLSIVPPKPVSIASPIRNANQLPQQMMPYNPRVINVPAKQFLADYMDSHIYKNRLASMGNTTIPDINNVLDAHITDVHGPGSIAYEKKQFPKIDSQHAGFPIIKGISNVNIDKGQIPYINNQYQVNQPADHVLAHEMSHVSRQLTPDEENLIAGLNKKQDEASAFKEYKKTGLTTPFSQYLNANYEGAHDARPNEIKADLDALRYTMHKKGIYDTSKRDMTQDDFNKASKDTEIKNSLEYKRLLQRFDAKDIILLNNNIADNPDKNKKQSQDA